MDEEAFTFGAFRLIPAQRVLFEDGQPLRLGSRALDILVAVVQHPGQTIAKEELIARAWPDTVVEEAALRVHVAALRKALGDGRAGRRHIANHLGRGYAFLAPVTRENTASATAAPTGMAEDGNLPAPLTRVVGRDDVISILAQQLARRRFLTIAGPGGIGKTTVALAVADRVRSAYKDGVWFVGLASLSDADLVPSAACAALGILLAGGDHTRALAGWLRDRNALLVLDNCEHVVGAAAALAEALLRAAPLAYILATTREPLRAEGEWLHRLPPLELPSQVRTSLTVAEALGYSAVELFTERATATTDSFVLDDAELPAVLEICRRLDGVPLALELAAARVDTIGVAQLAALLDDRFGVLTSGRRTALPRQQTLRATIDWSYELLPELERRLLRHLAVFVGGFTLEAAVAVEGAAIADVPLIDSIANLVAKSLVVFEAAVSPARWRLLDTIRAYALLKLVETGEIDSTQRRHASYFRDILALLASGPGSPLSKEELTRCFREIDNIRAALNWAFSPEGDIALGVALAATATDFWVAGSQIAEAREWASKALALKGDDAGSRHEMVLQCNLGMALIYTRGMIPPGREALMRALALAREYADFDYQQRAFHGLWLFSARSMAINDALAHARQYEEVARGRDPHAKAIADWLVGITQLYLADHNEARMRLQRAIDRYPVESRDRDMIRFVNDLRASAFGHLSTSLLSLGLLDTASQVAVNAVEEARGTSQPIVLCIALAWEAGLVFLSLGDLETAERCGDELVDLADKHGLRPFHGAGLCVRGSLAAKRGDPGNGLDALRAGLAEMHEASYLLFYPFFKAELAAALGAMGRVADGLAEVDGAMEFAKEADYRWFVPEILRTKGEVLLQQGLHNQALAEDHFRDAADLARTQGAPFWELRAGLSLARLLRRQGHHTEAKSILRPVYDSFTEGFATADLKAAKVLWTTH